MTRPLAPRGSSLPASALVAGLLSGALSWLALTTGVLPVALALAVGGGVLCAAAMLVARSPQGRPLALLGAVAAALPIVTVAVLLLASEG